MYRIIYYRSETAKGMTDGKIYQSKKRAEKAAEKILQEKKTGFTKIEKCGVYET